jgi:hypothetical protein
MKQLIILGKPYMYNFSNVSIWYDKPLLVYKYVRSSHHPFIHTHTHMQKAKHNFHFIDLKIKKMCWLRNSSFIASSMFQEIHKIWDLHIINLYKKAHFQVRSSINLFW